MTVTDEHSTTELLVQVRHGSRGAVDELFSRHRVRLRRMIQLRLDRRLLGHIDVSDVLREALVEVSRKLDEYLVDPQISFFLWLRMLADQKLAEIHRRHLGTQLRDNGLEFSIHRGALPEADSLALAARLLGRFTSASQSALKAERQVKLQESLNSLDPADREILALRHFEQLTNAETAAVIGLSESKATARHMRAIQRLKTLLEQSTGGCD